MFQRIKAAAEVVSFAGFDVVATWVPEMRDTGLHIKENIAEAWENRTVRGAALALGVVSVGMAAASLASRHDRLSNRSE